MKTFEFVVFDSSGKKKVGIVRARSLANDKFSPQLNDIALIRETIILHIRFRITIE